MAAQASEGAMETVEAVKFGFFEEGEVKKHSFVKVTNPILLDSVSIPTPGGLYDPAMGPFDDHTHCKSCGQRAFHCPGHCGHIDLIAPVYNPLLFTFLHTILQSTCFLCHHFRAEKSQVETCVSQLKFIIKGDVIEAKRLRSMPLDESSDLEDSCESSVSCSRDPSSTEYFRCGDLKQQKWTSLQMTEAISVLDNFLKQNHKTCMSCVANGKDSSKKMESKNPKITKPVFGWFHMAMSDASAKANVIRGSKLEGVFNNEYENTKKDANDISSGGNLKKRKDAPAEFIRQKNLFSGPLLPSEAKDILKLLWENEVELCSFINDIQRDHHFIDKEGYSMFFLETILVPPIKFRPPSKGGDSVMEHPQTVLLSKVLQSNISLGNAHVNNMERSKIVARWIELQQSINVLYDSKTAAGQREMPSGICQLLEKKEGIFRQKMMGKRVNFACRSVISPDPYLAVNEIGIPPYFALRLTYPERVTPWNSNKLRDAIINGPEIHPGATHYVDKLSTLLLRSDRRARMPVARKLQSSRGVVTQPRKSCDYEFEGKSVYRHVQDGDIVLVNRQPTLHKPSIMAHVVRVLKGEKTLRMHYANCSSYNADFDGDEMNVHLPQDEISRAEAYNIVNANNQYIVPTRGEPLRGLIQDHIVSSVLLTKKDTFLSRDQYNQLLYSSGVSFCGPVSSFCNPGQKVSVVTSEDEIQPLLPAILKPEPLWTGKQVITAVLNHITRGYPPFTVKKEGKISRSYFTNDEEKKTDEAEKKDREQPPPKEEKKSDEDEERDGEEPPPEEEKKPDEPEKKAKKPPGEETLYIFRNYLARGVIDKAQFDKYGLVHTVYELYGSSAAGNLLSALSRLFTVFLQIHGFTCGVDDLLLLDHHDIKRKADLQKCEERAENVHCKFLGVKVGEIGPMELQIEIEKAIRSTGESAVASLDNSMRSAMSELTSDVNKSLFPKGLLKSFPENCFNLMTTTGAKGSAVNFQQVSSLLGQQILEGKRVPRMVSGKTLPCFHPWDWKSRAGGYIIDNFLTGLRPQEYYFHCMAGREGLVDTAVKTSRSGYLQRCLIKNIESLKVCYDHTVRDIDGSIIQFSYGEDGLDVHQTSFIDRFESLQKNHEFYLKKIDQQQGKFNNYVVKLPSLLEEKARKFSEDLRMEQQDNSNKKRKLGNIPYKDFMKLVEHKYFSSLAQPGEPVGVIAAQSVGEPSTQMTLNTFHHAGRGEMNVTLGIPRLQEIIMTASSDIKTPIMTCPLQKGRSKHDAKSLAAKLKKVPLVYIIKSIKVFVEEQADFSKIYKLKMMLYKPKILPPNTNISLKDCRKVLKGLFLRELEDGIQNHLFLLSRISGIKNFVSDTSPKMSNDNYDDVSGGKQQRGEENIDDDDDDGIDEDDAEDLGLDVQKQKLQATDEVEYDDDSEDDGTENELNDSENVDETSQVEPSDAEDGTSEISQNDVIGQYDAEDGTSEMSSDLGKLHEQKSKDQKIKSVDKKKENVIDKLPHKETDRAIFVSAEGSHFEVHFKFANEPHVLLHQIAQKAAEKVYVNNSGKIVHCTVCNCSEQQVIYYGEDPKERKTIPHAELKEIPALQTAGLDFNAFWKMQDDLDIRYIYSNNTHAILNTYGVEAARASIIREIQTVFGSYGVTVDPRHLTLIADFMTHSGGYRPMSRNGGISESISPFSKISFETAAKFIKEAASYGLTDNLESPSARICLGLPVKLGTGCFDLMQKVEN